MPGPYLIDVNEILTPSTTVDSIKREKDLLILKALLAAREIKACWSKQLYKQQIKKTVQEQESIIILVAELLKFDRHKDSSKGKLNNKAKIHYEFTENSAIGTTKQLFESRGYGEFPTEITLNKTLTQIPLTERHEPNKRRFVIQEQKFIGKGASGSVFKSQSVILVDIQNISEPLDIQPYQVVPRALKWMSADLPQPPFFAEPETFRPSIKRMLRESWFTRECAEDNVSTPLVVLNKEIPSTIIVKECIPDGGVEPCYVALKDPFSADNKLKGRLLLFFIDGENLADVYDERLCSKSLLSPCAQMELIDSLDSLLLDLEIRYHKRNIIHSDIKLLNIIRTPDNKLKLIDNDHCRMKGKLGYSGTKGFIPEEAVGFYYSADFKKDIFSVGVVATLLFFLKIPAQSRPGYKKDIPAAECFIELFPIDFPKTENDFIYKFLFRLCCNYQARLPDATAARAALAELKQQLINLQNPKASSASISAPMEASSTSISVSQSRDSFFSDSESAIAVVPPVVQFTR